jgi:hypothetical protein
MPFDSIDNRWDSNVPPRKSWLFRSAFLMLKILNKIAYSIIALFMTKLVFELFFDN